MHRGRCAVVGNSGVLLNTTFGSDIDAHQVVIRLNAAPTYGCVRPSKPQPQGLPGGQRSRLTRGRRHAIREALARETHWVTLRACWVTLRARWVTLRAPDVAWHESDARAGRVMQDFTTAVVLRTLIVSTSHTHAGTLSTWEPRRRRA
jgi:hypothetical protein